MQQQALERRVRGLELLYEVGIKLSSERNHDRLIEQILVAAKEFCNADGGTIYMVNEHDQLEFAIMRNDTQGTRLGGTTGKPITFAPMPIHNPDGSPNHRNVATYVASMRESVNIADAYDTEQFDFSGTKAFDEGNHYRSKSFLTIPMLNNSGLVIGVLQLINAQDSASVVVPFSDEQQQIVEALASQAAIALDNQQLLAAQRKLMEAFIQMIAEAIDAKSPYTGGHCERVPIVTEMLTEAACAIRDGPFADFDLTEEQWYELRIAAWLHDCGKVTTPVHVMDKSTKLEAITDRIETVLARGEVIKRDLIIAHIEAGGRRGDPELQAQLQRLDDDLEFLRIANVGGEFMTEQAQARVREIAGHSYLEGNERRPLLEADEVDNLCIARGTLTQDERLVINGHMVQTIRMLERLPFPRDLKRVPEYAGGHHETMDGRGYPKGVFAGDMSIPARIMAIADVFEALTAQDRPYKDGKTLSETMRIMGFMKRDNHLDPDLLDLFVTSGVYRAYAKRYLPEELIDEVDEDAFLAIRPNPFDLPADDLRAERWIDFLPQYQPLVNNVLGALAVEPDRRRLDRGSA